VKSFAALKISVSKLAYKCSKGVEVMFTSNVPCVMTWGQTDAMHCGMEQMGYSKLLIYTCVFSFAHISIHPFLNASEMNVAVYHLL